MRISKVKDLIDDRFRLELWGKRMVALGLVDRRDLQLAVSAHRGDKGQLDKLCKEALNYAQASAAANVGTALHTLAEMVDKGVELPPIDAEALADLAAYEDAMAPFEVVLSETFVVVDELKAAGSFDRILAYEGRNYIADIKTGAGVDFIAGGVAIQLALYSRGQLYDPGTGVRMPLDVDQDRGILIHLPQGAATCTLYWIDIQAGWLAAQLATRVRNFRTYAKKNLHEPFNTTEVTT